MFAELDKVQIQQTGPVTGLLLLHLLEKLGRCRIGFAEPVYKVAVDSAILLFESDRKSKNLLLREILEVLGHDSIIGGATPFWTAIRLEVFGAAAC